MTTSSQTQTIERLLDLVSHLSRPSCGIDDMEWEVDVSAGKQLLEWLPSQNTDRGLPLCGGDKPLATGRRCATYANCAIPYSHIRRSICDVRVRLALADGLRRLIRS